MFLPLVLAIHVLFAASLGLILSVVCQSTVRANITLVFTLVGIVAVTWLAGYMLKPLENKLKTDAVYATRQGVEWDDREVLRSAIQMLDPIRAWWRLSESPTQVDDDSIYDRRPLSYDSYASLEEHRLKLRLRDAVIALFAALGYLIFALMCLLAAFLRFCRAQPQARRMNLAGNV